MNGRRFRSIRGKVFRTQAQTAAYQVWHRAAFWQAGVRSMEAELSRASF